MQGYARLDAKRALTVTRIAWRERMRTKAQRCRSCSTFPHLQLLRYCERSCNTPQLVKPLEAKAAVAAPHAVYDGEFCNTLREARAAGAAPRTPYKKDGPAVNGCFQSIDEEAPNWQALIETLVRIVFPSGVFAPMRRADSANHGARECERTPHPRAVWAASCPASCGDSGRSDAAHPLCPARRVALPLRGRSW